MGKKLVPCVQCSQRLPKMESTLQVSNSRWKAHFSAKYLSNINARMAFFFVFWLYFGWVMGFWFVGLGFFVCLLCFKTYLFVKSPAQMLLICHKGRRQVL